MKFDINLKAALLSGFLLPGLGQIYKGDKIKGLVIIALLNIIFILSMFVILPGAGKLMMARIADKQKAMTAFTAYITEYSTSGKILLTILIAIWVYSAADAAFSRKQLKTEGNDRGDN